ncbi:zinc finger MYM-type protein 1-like [Siphateles boraxobius]|uniref:zinc finger MYM-type protein 1-like n=1 Tax=Siphateles boraxobius TaxID=180520 RepID=UPI0040632100
MSGSYIHHKWLEIQKEMYGGQPRELQKLSDTRWACRYFACRNMMNRLPAVLCVLEDIAEERSGDRSVEARGLLAQIDLPFIGLLTTFCKVLGDTKLLSDMLQSPSLDLARAVELIEALQDTFKNYREESFCDELWRDILNTAQKCNISIENVEKRQRKTSSRLQGSVVTSTVGGHRSDQDDKDGFRKNIFYPILDSVIGELQKRFSKPNCNIMRGVQALHPNSNSFLQESPFFSFAEIYESDLDDLKHELHQAKRILERKRKEGMQSLTSILEFTVFLEPFKEVFHELFRLCKIAIAIPVSTASCERSFSTLKLIKNHLRTTMSDERLSDLGVHSVESRRAKSLDMDEFIRLFGSQHKNRRIQLF